MLKSPSDSPKLKQLKLDKTNNQRFLKKQLFYWWRPLLPAVLQICLQNLRPGALTTFGGAEQSESLCSPVPEAPIVGVLQLDPNSLLCAAEVQGEALFRSGFLIRCQPEVELGWKLLQRWKKHADTADVYVLFSCPEQLNR